MSQSAPSTDLIVLGAGAAGCFAAANAAAHNPAARILLLEKTAKPLAKLRISGGGRCNVTHHCTDVARLVTHYPRGARELRQAFARFAVPDTIRWFESRGARLKTEPDGRMFPVTDDSATIADTLLHELHDRRVDLRLHTDVRTLTPTDTGWRLTLASGDVLTTRAVIVATGGSPKLEGLQWLAQLGHTLVPPVPSLFTFNLPGQPITALQGVASPDVEVSIVGQKIQARGPVLITHWGLSGPAILRCSAWGARALADLNYHFDVRLRWLPDATDDGLRTQLDHHRATLATRQLANRNPFGLPQRLWDYLLTRAGIALDLRWADLPNPSRNRLLELLLRDTYPVRGKTTFKEEFVTAGGISLKDVDFTTLQSRRAPGLFFAGEVLDIDGITGGFNFQAAWTTGFIAGTSALR